ncbi:hypothetical protein [Paenibacillus glacialis]|uniref:Uncharacterized protein n=1 Tax=Paenibacillus glacialis TaxID=494026 RepID=A0A168BXA4_9BACL|nr:hypothetical protein [Paenibacillus glacialis]OAB32854.1 hypothetical protein PGLA_25505 [Paenibacillus glacialis]
MVSNSGAKPIVNDSNVDVGNLSDSGEKAKQTWGVGSLSSVISISGLYVCTIQTKSLSQLEALFQAFSSIKSLLGIGLIVLSYMLSKSYPNHKFSVVGKKIAIFLFYAYLIIIIFISVTSLIDLLIS